MNTWWNDEPVPDSIYESHRRRDFYELFVKVTSDREILTVRGPRQVGKTTIVGQMIDELLPEEVSRRKRDDAESSRTQDSTVSKHHHGRRKKYRAYLRTPGMDIVYTALAILFSLIGICALWWWVHTAGDWLEERW